MEIRMAYQFATQMFSKISDRRLLFKEISLFSKYVLQINFCYCQYRPRLYSTILHKLPAPQCFIERSPDVGLNPFIVFSAQDFSHFPLDTDTMESYIYLESNCFRVMDFPSPEISWTPMKEPEEGKTIMERELPSTPLIIQEEYVYLRYLYINDMIDNIKINCNKVRNDKKQRKEGFPHRGKWKHLNFLVKKRSNLRYAFAVQGVDYYKIRNLGWGEVETSSYFKYWKDY